MPERPPPRVWVEIDLKKIQSNYKKISDKVKPSEVMAVLKADAYGLGVIPIARALKMVGASIFGVAESREALSLRDLGATVQILGGLLDTDIQFVVSEGIVAPIPDFETARLLNIEALKQQKVVECQFLIDTGMGRLGIPFSKAEAVIIKTVGLRGLKCIGIYSHFPHAYGDLEFSKSQVNRIIELLNRLRTKGIVFRWIHIANSDGINNIPDSYKVPYNMVRTGINLYGIFDPEGKKSLNLEPVVTLKTRLVAIRKLEKGTTISYGRTYRITKPTLVGTIAIGYADGLPMAMSNNGYVLLHGKKCPILGRISMDYTTICIESVPSATVGDQVICLGQTISINDWATRKNSIPYDVICSLGSRVDKHYVHKPAHDT